MLAAQCLAVRVAAGRIYQFDRGTAASVFCPDTSVMLVNPSCRILGDAGIKGAIRASQDVDGPDGVGNFHTLDIFVFSISKRFAMREAKKCPIFNHGIYSAMWTRSTPLAAPNPIHTIQSLLSTAHTGVNHYIFQYILDFTDMRMTYDNARSHGSARKRGTGISKTCCESR
jgi:hypothetical protein